jgi:hypothetical protein
MRGLQMILFAKDIIENCRRDLLKTNANDYGFTPEQIERIKKMFKKYLINDIPLI